MLTQRYLLLAQRLVGALQVGQRHPQGVELGAARRQLSPALVPLGPHALSLRLQGGELHCGAGRETVSRTVSKTGSKKGSRTGSKTVSRTVSRTVIKTGSKTGSRTVSRTVIKTGSKTVKLVVINSNIYV